MTREIPWDDDGDLEPIRAEQADGAIRALTRLFAQFPAPSIDAALGTVQLQIGSDLQTACRILAQLEVAEWLAVDPERRLVRRTPAPEETLQTELARLHPITTPGGKA